jgi:hypothetical protein
LGGGEKNIQICGTMSYVRAALLLLVSALLWATAAAAQRNAQPASAGTARFVVRLTADNHRPRASATWHYVVRARDKAGRPVAGTAIVRVLVRGKIVDTLGWFGFNGKLRRGYRWSPHLKGSYAVLQAKVVGPGGSRIAGYGVRVRRASTLTTGTPRFRATLRGASHSAAAGAAWRYVVRAVDRAGRPVKGTAIVRVFVGSKRVDTVGWFGFKGVLRRTYRWSSNLQGANATLKARVVGPGGTRLLAYAVRVR